MTDLTTLDFVRAVAPEKRMKYIFRQWKEHPDDRDEYENIAMILCKEMGISEDLVTGAFKAMRSREEKEGK